jgi:3-methyladenine DNA glycosylase/8-oxoguanine DNA glycosylase
VRVNRRAAAPSKTEVAVEAPSDFSLLAVVASHGWYQLAPYDYRPDQKTLRTTWRLGAAAPVSVALRQEKAAVVAHADRRLGAEEVLQLAGRVRYALSLDAEVARFHRVCRREPRLRWIASRKLGRFLRGEDLFEDALKTLLTTNCTWTQTKGMVRRLVDAAGSPTTGDGGRAFPTPDAVTALGARGFADVVKAGYRGPAALELAERAEAGEVERLLDLEPAAARATILSWRGFGPYAASSLLHLLGANDQPVVDSWALAQAKKHAIGGRKPSAATIRRHYADYGAEAARVAWFDLNRDHYAAWPPRFTRPDVVAAD